MSKELIEELREKADSLTTTVGVMNLLHEAADALEAKAAPAGEREAFEFAERASDLARDDDEPDQYANPYVQSAWEGFKAGAAHQRQHGEYSDAYQGAREGLAIWKRRALEAEARVRQQDQIIDQMGEDLNAINGPTFMGEPVLPRQQAREVVMPERKDESKYCSLDLVKARQWNACLDEFARLNKGAGSHE